jgi:hypothetical protein
MRPACFPLVTCTMVVVTAVAFCAAVRSNPLPAEGHGASGPSATPNPICGQQDDKQVHVPADWATLIPPAVGHSYTDSTFGCEVTRLTASGAEEELSDGTHPSFMNYYSTFSAVNAADTMVLIVADNGSWRVKDIKGNLIVAPGKMPTMNNGHPVWDTPNGNTFYYTVGKTLNSATISGKSVKSNALYTFQEYSSIVSPDAADLSQDGDHIALVGENPNHTMDIFVWSLHGHNKTSVYTTNCKVADSVAQTPQPGCLHKLQLTANNLLSIEFAEDGSGAEQGLRLWDGGTLISWQNTTNHYDTGYDLSGDPVYIASNNSATLPSFTNPCRSGWGMDVRQLRHLSSAICLLDHQPSWHVSYRGNKSQPWAALSFFDDRKPGPELFDNERDYEAPSSKNWRLYEDEIMLARVDGGAVHRLAHARTRSVENFWASPRAAISRDGKYVIFTSNMAYPHGCPANMHVANDCTDVYLIKSF